jgi:hypothetical protein
MHNERDDANAAGPATREDEAAVMSIDWPAIIARVGVHPDLHLHGGVAWWVNGELVPDAAPDATDWVRARPATVRDLMLCRMTEALDALRVNIMTARDNRGPKWYVSAAYADAGTCRALENLAMAVYPTRFAATVAAVLCLPERGEVQ